MQTRTILRIGAALAVVAAIIVVAQVVPVVDTANWLMDYVRGFGIWAGVVYTLIALGAVLVGIPIFALMVLSGMLFDLWVAMTSSFIMVVGGGCIGFGLARLFGFGRNDEEHRRATSLLARLRRMVAGHEVLMIVMLRLTPTLPYGATNVVLGSWQIRFLHFAIGTVMGMIPAVLLITYLGHAGRVGLTADKPLEELPPEMILLFGVGALAFIALSVILGLRLRTILAEDKENEEEDDSDDGDHEPDADDTEPPRIG
ncbi:MAG: TVP38/TMEM64 family protein [Planctomycetota bacterium]